MCNILSLDSSTHREVLGGGGEADVKLFRNTIFLRVHNPREPVKRTEVSRHPDAVDLGLASSNTCMKISLSNSRNWREVVEQTWNCSHDLIFLAVHDPQVNPNEKQETRNLDTDDSHLSLTHRGSSTHTKVLLNLSQAASENGGEGENRSENFSPCV